MLKLAQARDELNVVSDQRGCPTYAGDIAQVLTYLISRFQNEQYLPWGTYHCCNAGECNWYEFAAAIFEEGFAKGLIDKAPVVNPISTVQYPTPAARPAYSVLDTKKLNKLLEKPMPHWQEGLAIVIDSLNDRVRSQ